MNPSSQIPQNAFSILSMLFWHLPHFLTPRSAVAVAVLRGLTLLVQIPRQTAHKAILSN